MSEICQKCMAAAEDIPQDSELLPCPEGCCIVCWVRYGRFIPACKTGKEIYGDQNRENTGDDSDRLL